MGAVSILTVTGLGERRDWLIEAARSVQREKDSGVPVSWLLGVRGYEELSPEVEFLADIVIRLPLDTHVSDARNALLEYVLTEYVCTLDDDDVLIEGGLVQRISHLDNNDNLGWVAGHMQDMDSMGNLGDIWQQPAVEGEYEAGDLVKCWSSPENWFVCISHSFLIRVDLVRQFNGWRKMSQEDILLVCQVSQVSRGMILSAPMVGYRRHDYQVSRSALELAIREDASRVIFEQLTDFDELRQISS